MTTATDPFYSIGHWYESYRQHLVGIGLKLGYHQEEVNDIINQFFLGILEKKTDPNTISNPQAYLTVAFKHKLVDQYRSKSRNQFLDAGQMDELLVVPSILESIESLQSNSELIQSIRIAYKKLPLRCQKVIHLKYYEGLTTEQIAEQTGLSKRTVYNNLFEGIKLLRMGLSEVNSSVKLAALLSILPVVIMDSAL